ncbi:1-acyl-sn-glycerol-3-phosphate acyltransferase [Gemmatimonas sp.]|uniref:1-acyl-sn-glycerol-3-phosphate acyltransferase n=1 Tax=Gemmatimonas sp. TaxID=1962908 RepID=UPI0039833E10
MARVVGALFCLLVLAGALWATRRYAHGFARRAGRRTVMHARVRIDRYKLTRKAYVIDALLADEAIAAAVRAHSEDSGTTEAETWDRVRRYLDEIVPFFNILAYYRLGYWVSRAVLSLFYKVSVEYERPDPFRGVPRNSVVIYLMNHRSNADYVLVAYVMMGAVSISYAVGEWARAFPLEVLFKSFGSYFIRRRYREPLYHAVLQSYVQLITRNSVTQGIFPEGGLTRDGALRPAKIGLLDYALGVARDPDVRSRMYVVPVGINYDRVIEDRTLLRELETRSQVPTRDRVAQAANVGRFVLWNLGRLVTRRWRRYGRAAVTIGSPISVDSWLTGLEAEGVSLFDAPRADRLPLVQHFCDAVLKRIGAIIPVTPVPLACAALQSFDVDFVSREALLERMSAMRDVLAEFNARVLQADRDIEATFDRAYRMLRMRRVIARIGTGFLILPNGRPLITYYANSIVHLLGPFGEGMRARDALPLHDWERDALVRGPAPG